jgi:hypothetical protein
VKVSTSPLPHLLQQYKGYWIDGKAGLVHPFSPESYPAGQIFKPARAGSIEEVTRFALPSFKMADKDLAAFLGFEWAKMVIDHCWQYHNRSKHREEMALGLSTL